MRDDDRGAVGEQGLQRPSWIRRSRRDVERCRRLVEDQHRGVGEEGPRERDQLPLPGRHAAAALVDVGVVAVRQRLDELVGADRARGARGSRRASRPACRARCCRRPVPLNRYASCVTMTIARRRSFGCRSRRSTPSSASPAARVVEPRRSASRASTCGTRGARRARSSARREVELELGQDDPARRGTRSRTSSKPIAPVGVPQVDRLHRVGQRSGSSSTPRSSPSAAEARAGTSCRTSRSPPSGRRSSSRTARPPAARPTASAPSATRSPPTAATGASGVADDDEARIEHAEQASIACAFTSR